MVCVAFAVNDLQFFTSFHRPA